MTISKLTVENLTKNCVTDHKNPRISFAIASEKEDVKLASATISLGSWNLTTDRQVLIPYAGAPLKPFTKYTVTVKATDNYGETDTAETTFETGRLSLPWKAKWITDGA